jgi:hypothetical protein
VLCELRVQTSWTCSDVATQALESGEFRRENSLALGAGPDAPVRGSVEVKAACVRPGASVRRLPTDSRQRRQRTAVSSVSKAALCQWAESPA